MGDAAGAAPFVLVEDRGPVRWLTMNRARSYNPLSLAMISALHTALSQARDAEEVRCVVVRGDGRGFSAGHDLREVREHRGDADGGVAFFEKLMGACSDMMTTIVRHPQPVIACVDGIATAAGAQLVASCDLAYAAEGSRFATPGVNIGLFCSTPMVALTRNVAAKHAMEMLLTGEMIDADRAVQIGLINRVVAAYELEAEVTRIAEVVAGKSMHTLRSARRRSTVSVSWGSPTPTPTPAR